MLFREKHLKMEPHRIGVDNQNEVSRKLERYGNSWPVWMVSVSVHGLRAFQVPATLMRF